MLCVKVSVLTSLETERITREMWFPASRCKVKKEAFIPPDAEVSGCHAYFASLTRYMVVMITSGKGG
jgi:hypothetical protein